MLIFKNKSEIPVDGLKCLKRLEKKKYLLQYIRLNKNGKNKKIEKLVKQVYPIIKFNFFVSDTQQ